MIIWDAELEEYNKTVMSEKIMKENQKLFFNLLRSNNLMNAKCKHNVNRAFKKLEKRSKVSYSNLNC